jgi:DNA-binding MarR family transcriptional regulator
VRLVRRRPGVSVAQAAAELGVAPNTVSTLVRDLTEAGMLVRTTDESDRRVARLALPEPLARRFGEWRDRRLVALGDALATLEPAQQATIASAAELLRQVADELERVP